LGSDAPNPSSVRDKQGDPHSPVDGKWWAHMDWILTGKSMHHDARTLAHYVPDLAKDKFHVWITKYDYVPMIVLGVILLTIGGLPLLMWGIFMRTVVGLHATWLVNSATTLREPLQCVRAMTNPMEIDRIPVGWDIASPRSFVGAVGTAG
jgi:hypothetical protein